MRRISAAARSPRIMQRPSTWCVQRRSSNCGGVVLGEVREILVWHKLRLFVSCSGAATCSGQITGWENM